MAAGQQVYVHTITKMQWKILTVIWMLLTLLQQPAQNQTVCPAKSYQAMLYSAKIPVEELTSTSRWDLRVNQVCTYLRFK